MDEIEKKMSKIIKKLIKKQLVNHIILKKKLF